ncbi:serine/arginine repetitive matrix protein 1-like isoform X2 [Eleutherodactylus coqui]|uniref:serine/arginine repetitive matrix protein 1-like isoform X2 n=1 Tax=Eleutherodactylus coqui TaxID=57060 RepID=UPI003462F578
MEALLARIEQVLEACRPTTSGAEAPDQPPVGEGATRSRRRRSPPARLSHSPPAKRGRGSRSAADRPPGLAPSQEMPEAGARDTRPAADAGPLSAARVQDHVAAARPIPAGCQSGGGDQSEEPQKEARCSRASHPEAGSGGKQDGHQGRSCLTQRHCSRSVSSTKSSGEGRHQLQSSIEVIRPATQNQNGGCNGELSRGASSVRGERSRDQHTETQRSARQPSDTAQKPPARQPSDTAQKPPARQPSDTAQKPPARQPSDTAQKPPARQPSDTAQKPPARQPSDTAQKPPARQPSDTAQKPPARQPSDTAQKPPAVPIPPATQPSDGRAGDKRHIWIVGNDFIYWAEQRARIRPLGVNLGLKNAVVHWHGIRGLQWSKLLYEVVRIRRWTPRTVVLLIHAGGNDMGSTKVGELIAFMRQDMGHFRRFFKNVVLVWSDIISRGVWRGERNPGGIERARKGANLKMSQLMPVIGGVAVRHWELEGQNAHLLKEDGENLNEVGLDIFLSGLQDGLEAALVLAEGRRTA